MVLKDHLLIFKFKIASESPFYEIIMLNVISFLREFEINDKWPSRFVHRNKSPELELIYNVIEVGLIPPGNVNLDIRELFPIHFSVFKTYLVVSKCNLLVIYSQLLAIARPWCQRNLAFSF